ncbi:unnamed protein product [Amaranthus hypochondriacus]
MGNQRFKLSNMIPNAWFYKLKDINYTKNPKSQSKNLKKDQIPPISSSNSTKKITNNNINNNPPKILNYEPHFQPRKSYHITRESIPSQELEFLTFSPSRRSKSSTKSKKSNSYHSKSNSSSSTPLNDDTLLKTEHKTEDFDIVFDIEKDSLFTKINTFDLKLPPIITKQEQKPRNFSPSPRKFQEKGMKLKVNSPRINGISGRKSMNLKKRRSISESFAVVKSSFDPQRDFKESMVEMIVQNNLRTSKDLEDLLACYLSLNSDEYHDVIIKVFKQIWFDFRHQK